MAATLTRRYVGSRAFIISSHGCQDGIIVLLKLSPFRKEKATYQEWNSQSTWQQHKIIIYYIINEVTYLSFLFQLTFECE